MLREQQALGVPTLQLLLSGDGTIHCLWDAYREGLVAKEVDLVKVVLHKLQAVGLVPALKPNPQQWNSETRP